MKYKFLDIGTSCFATSIDNNFRQGKDKGILVEPIKKYLDLIPDIQGVIKANFAISNYCGEGTMYAPIIDHDLTYTPKEYFEIEDKKISGEYGKAGSNSLNKKHPNMDKFKREFETIPCSVITLESLCSMFEINEVESIKIDTEGHENIVLIQLIQLMRDKKITIKKSITFESNYLNNQQELLGLGNTICNEFGFKFEGKFGKDQNILLIKE
jgi:FkbM family methyltransferase